MTETNGGRLTRCDMSDLPQWMCAHCDVEPPTGITVTKYPTRTYSTIWRTPTAAEQRGARDDGPKAPIGGTRHLIEADKAVPQVVAVGRDLRLIEDMCQRLIQQAVSQGDHPEIPGGEAMIALADVSSIEAWENRQQTTERYAEHADERLRRIYTSIADEDPDEAWPAYQHIRFWSEAWRREREADYEMKHTILTEVNFIRESLTWAWSNELAWTDFADDIKTAVIKLENILSEGERAQLGAPCLYDECKGVRLFRKMVPVRGEDGEKAWKISDWKCPRCRKSWDEDAYARMVVAATELAKVEVIDGEVWCALDYAARKVRRSPSTVRVWLHRGQLSEACLIKGRRRFVRLADVFARDADSPRKQVRANETTSV